MKYFLVEATWPDQPSGSLVHVKKEIYQSETIEEAIAKAREQFGSVAMNVTQVQPHRFSVGDRVTFLNDYGVSWPKRTISELAPPNVAGVPCYFVTPSQTPWASLPEGNLYLEGNE